LARWHYW